MKTKTARMSPGGGSCTAAGSAQGISVNKWSGARLLMGCGLTWSETGEVLSSGLSSSRREDLLGASVFSSETGMIMVGIESC